MEYLDGNTKEIRYKRYLRKLDNEINRLKRQNATLDTVNGILDQVVWFGVFATIIHLVYKFT